MRTVSVRLADLEKAIIPIGFVGENLHTQVRIDCKKAFEDYPTASVSITVNSPNGDKYPAVVVRDGDMVTWDVTNSDLLYTGAGEIQLTFTVDEVVAKSFKGRIKILDSIVATGETPTPVQNWIDNATEVLAEVEEAIPTGGTTGQVLAKKTDSNYDLEWVDQTGGGGTSDYSELTNKPQINSVTLSGNKSLSDLGIAAASDIPVVTGFANKVSSATENNFAALTSNGDLKDSGKKASDFLTSHQDISGKADKVSSAINGNFAGLDSNGNLTDSGKKASDFGTYSKPSGGIPAADLASGVLTSIIDDTAGDGATNKVWSADKSYDTNSAVLSAITQKADIKATAESSADLYVCDDDGNVIAEFKNGHIITKNFDSSTGGLIADAVQNTADLFVCDANGNVIAEFANGHIKTKYFDSSSTATSGILSRVDKQMDGIYAACRWHQPTLSSKQFCLLLAGDSHNDSTRMNSMVNFLNSIDAFDAGIMLGDMSGNEFTDPITNYINAIQNTQKPFLTVLGNHDVVGATSDSDLYTKYGDCFQYASLTTGEAVSGKCYYYKDFASYKIRVIVMMQYDISYSGNLCYGQDQIDWFVDVLNDTPSDYGVIIAEHTNPSRYMTYNLDGSVTSSTWYQSNYAPTDMSGDPVPDIVDAWIDGSTLSQTYSYTFSNPPSALSVSADFTSRGAGEFITYIGGHWHMNVLGTPTSYTDQMDYHVPATGLSAATQGDMPRKAGTVSEDSLNVLAVDRDKKTVKVYQIGAHYTKDAVDRQFFKYSYGS